MRRIALHKTRLALQQAHKCLLTSQRTPAWPMPTTTVLQKNVQKYEIAVLPQVEQISITFSQLCEARSVLVVLARSSLPPHRHPLISPSPHLLPQCAFGPHHVFLLFCNFVVGASGLELPCEILKGPPDDSPGWKLNSGGLRLFAPCHWKVISSRHRRCPPLSSTMGTWKTGWRTRSAKLRQLQN